MGQGTRAMLGGEWWARASVPAGVSHRLVFQDGKIEAEDFTSRLYRELNSSPQPYLVPFLKVTVKPVAHHVSVPGWVGRRVGTCVLKAYSALRLNIRCPLRSVSGSRGPLHRGHAGAVLSEPRPCRHAGQPEGWWAPPWGARVSAAPAVPEMVSVL